MVNSKENAALILPYYNSLASGGHLINKFKSFCTNSIMIFEGCFSLLFSLQARSVVTFLFAVCVP